MSVDASSEVAYGPYGSSSSTSSPMTLSHAVEKKDLTAGDHIYVYRWGLAYSHHAIVVSCQECSESQCKHEGACCEVVHLQRTGEVVLEPLAEFCCGSQVRRFRYGASTIEAVVKRAGSCSRQEPDPWFVTTLRALSLVTPEGTEPAVKYNVLWRNCELFAVWCKIGHRAGIKHFLRDSAVSAQSGSGILKAGGAMAAAATVLAAAPEIAVAGAFVAGASLAGGAASSSSTTPKTGSKMVEESAIDVEKESVEQRCRVHFVLRETLRALGLAIPQPLEEQCLFGSKNQYVNETKTKQCPAVAMVCDLLATSCENPDGSRSSSSSTADGQTDDVKEQLSETTAFMRLQECLFEFAEY